MLKKITKGLVLSLMCTFLLASSVCAKEAYYSFSLRNTGSSIIRFSYSENDKKFQSNPWTLKVESITCSGKYGIRFAPAKYYKSTDAAIPCPKSAVWRSGTGYGTVAYAEGDASLMTYKLGARQDDSYYSTFSSSGWWNADRLSDR